MKSLMLFLREVLDDLGTWCCTSTTRDLETVTRRIEHEGLSFLTITLSSFGEDFQKSLDQGYVGHDQFKSFSFSGGLPRFLGGFLDHVFDRGSARLLDDPCSTCIISVRQFTLMFGKINLPCTKAREKSAYKGYVECERSVRDSDNAVSSDSLSRFSHVSRLLWANLLSAVDREIYNGEVVPKHGPGSTSDSLFANAKWNQTEWPRRLDTVFPAGEYLLPNWRYHDNLSDVLYLEPGEERPVKVISVPKTLKTPRIIAIEPTCMQYVQQGILRSIVDNLAKDDLLTRLVGWKSSEPNQLLALKGSITGSLATLDLREASDRVSNQHVRLLLSNHPHLFEAVDACRSRKADVPGFGVQRLAKFASMGSALTFPFESMVFCTVVFMGIEQELNRPLTRKDIKSFSSQVRVFGDDLIIPVDFVDAVIRNLEIFGFQVNLSKSFWTGKFRESCGKEYYNGSDVSIVRVRSLFPAHRTDAVEIVKTVALRNHLYKVGLWKSTAYLDRLLGGLIPMPMVLDTSPLLGRHSFLGYDNSQRYDAILHRPLVKGVQISPIIPSSRLEDSGALLKILTIRGEMPIPDVRHLSFAGRPRSVNTKTRWATPY